MGTMEEKIYERQVTKLAISKRVIDEQQIDRHYKAKDLNELYMTNLDADEERPPLAPPKDLLFAEQLRKFNKLIYKYHEQDSLLENKEEETLSKAEIDAAWEEYEQEKNRKPVMQQNFVPQYQQRGLFAIQFRFDRFFLYSPYSIKSIFVSPNSYSWSQYLWYSN